MMKGHINKMKLKKTLGMLVSAGIIGLFGCGDSRVSNMKEYTADFLGNQDGYVTNSELRDVKTLTDAAAHGGKDNVYIPFLIDGIGNLKKVFKSGALHTGNSVPSNPISLTSYPGFCEEELMQMALEHKEWPEGREWTEKDYIDRFGFKEINKNGEISGTYILRETGMQKQ